MFAKPVGNLKFSNVESFCKRFGEGVRVEYKENMPKNIPKTISAFANTLGGILILGVKTDKNNRAIIPIEGMKKQQGIEEKITDSSLHGIYPAVLPEVKIIDVPNMGNRIVVVVEVHESIEAPHAIENSTRVYIRTGSQSQPYELAEIDRIEYMLKRRQKPLEKKKRLLSMAENRYVMNRQVQQQTVAKLSTLQIVVSVAFPYQPLISLEHLDRFVRNIPREDPARLFNDYIKRVHEGICSVIPWRDRYEYLEINQYGFVFWRGDIRKVNSEWKDGSSRDQVLYVSFPWLVADTGKMLHLADLFFAQCGYIGNVEVKLTINNILKEKLIYTDPFEIGYEATDNQASGSGTYIAHEMKTNLAAIVSNLMKGVLWVFNYDAEKFRTIEQRVRKTLLANGMIPTNRDD